MAYCLSLAPLRSASPRGPQQPLSSVCFGLCNDGVQRRPLAALLAHRSAAAAACEELALAGLMRGLWRAREPLLRTSVPDAVCRGPVTSTSFFIAARMRTRRLAELLAVNLCESLSTLVARSDRSNRALDTRSIALVRVVSYATQSRGRLN